MCIQGWFRELCNMNQDCIEMIGLMNHDHVIIFGSNDTYPGTIAGLLGENTELKITDRGKW